MKRYLLQFTLLLALTNTISGCGLKGPLVLPKNNFSDTVGDKTQANLTHKNSTSWHNQSLAHD